MENDHTALSFGWGKAWAKLAGPNSVMVFLLFAVVGLSITTAVFAYDHMRDSKERSKTIIEALEKVAIATEKLTIAQKSTTSAVKENTCMVAIPMDRRAKEYFADNGICKRIVGDPN